MEIITYSMKIGQASGEGEGPVIQLHLLRKQNRLSHTCCGLDLRNHKMKRFEKTTEKLLQEARNLSCPCRATLARADRSQRS